MPQMSPLPWTLLLFMTLISLVAISTIIYFSTQSFTSKINPVNTYEFKLKW